MSDITSGQLDADADLQPEPTEPTSTDKKE